jgi:hypothetical protein
MSVSAIVPAVCVVLAFAYVLRTYVLTRRSDQKETPARVVRHVPMTEREFARLRWPWEVDERELGWAPATPVLLTSFADFERQFVATKARWNSYLISTGYSLAPRETTEERHLREGAERLQPLFDGVWREMFGLAERMVPGGVH